MVLAGFFSVSPAPDEPLQAAPAKSGVETIAMPDKRPAMPNPARIFFKRSLSMVFLPPLKNFVTTVDDYLSLNAYGITSLTRFSHSDPASAQSAPFGCSRRPLS
jgi:hypothetical protein